MCGRFHVGPVQVRNNLVCCEECGKRGLTLKEAVDAASIEVSYQRLKARIQLYEPKPLPPTHPYPRPGEAA